MKDGKLENVESPTLASYEPEEGRQKSKLNTKPDHFVDVNKIADNWNQLRDTISEMAENGGDGTQEDVCRYLLKYMDVLEQEE